MPWVEKYRPKKVNDVAAQEEVVASLRNAIETGNLPHLLMYGPPGTGKTSTVLAAAREMFGVENMRDRVLELNASDERGIKIIREKVKNFASTTVSQKSVNGKLLPPFKLIILDEADSMTHDAQSALRRTMELYTKVTRFCLICNYVSRIIEPLASRCAKFRFSNLSNESFLGKIAEISTAENLNVDPDALDSLVLVSKGDMRKGITLLQTASQFNKRHVTSEVVLETAGYPPHDIFVDIWKSVKTKDFDTVSQCASNILAEGYSLSLLAIIMQEQLLDNDDFTDIQKAKMLSQLAVVDTSIQDGASEALQLRALLSRFVTAQYPNDIC